MEHQRVTIWFSLGPEKMEILELTSEALSDATEALTEILYECVQAGASVGFVLPFDKSSARGFWTDVVFPAVESRRTHLFVVKHMGEIVGTVQLGVSMPANQPHRADVAKLLVHPMARRVGCARALMAHLLNHATQVGKSLLVLDTRSGDPSQRLYTSLGFETAGEIPFYCQNPFDGRLEATTYMYKVLSQ